MDLRSPLQAVWRKRCNCDHAATDGADTGVLAGCFRQFPSGGCLCPAVFLPAAGCVRQVSFRWLVVSGRFRPSNWLFPTGFLRVAGCVPYFTFQTAGSVLRFIFNRLVLSFRLPFERLVLSYRLPFERLVLSYRLPFRRLFCPRFYLPNSSFICLRVYCQRLWCHKVYRLNGWFCVRVDPSSRRFARGLEGTARAHSLSS